MKVDMSPEAITARLRQTSELRRLCLALAGDRFDPRSLIHKHKSPMRKPEGQAPISDQAPASEHGGIEDD